MVQVTIEDAQSRLGELIASGIPGEEIGIIQGSRLVAKLVPLVSDDAPGSSFGSAKDSILFIADDFDAPLEHLDNEPRRPGTAAGSILYLADDFDAPLEDFREYME